MSRTISVYYDEHGYKAGKMKFCLDGAPCLSLANHEHGVIELPDTNEHVITAKIWGVFPVYKGRIDAGSDDWRLAFEQPDANRMGKFSLVRVSSDTSAE